MVELKDVPGYEGYYKASSDGHVYSCRANRFMSEFTNKHGYKMVYLMHPKKPSKRWLVHRIIATTFIPNPEGKEVVNHKNEVKDDNRVINLEWLTNVENINYGTGRLRALLNGMSSNILGKRIKQLTADGKYVKSYNSIKQARKINGISDYMMERCLKEGRIHNGYRWEYV